MSATNAMHNPGVSPIHTRLFQAKAAKGLTFDDIAKALNRDEVWVAAAFYGQAKFDRQSLEKLAQILDLNSPTDPSLRTALFEQLGQGWFPDRGAISPMPPTDPLIYRLYEGVLVYGSAIKAVILEKFGVDGIMSMIDCTVHVDKKEDEHGNKRVVLTFDGKFLPYATW